MCLFIVLGIYGLVAEIKIYYYYNNTHLSGLALEAVVHLLAQPAEGVRGGGVVAPYYYTHLFGPVWERKKVFIWQVKNITMRTSSGRSGGETRRCCQQTNKFIDMNQQYKHKKIYIYRSTKS